MFFKRNKEETNIIIKEVYSGLVYMVHNEPVYIKKDKFYFFISPRALDSWRLDAVNISGRLPAMTQTEGGTLGFRDGSLIQNAKDGRIYLISDSKRRLLTAPLGDYGFDYSQVIEVSDAEIQFHTEGEDIG